LLDGRDRRHRGRVDRHDQGHRRPDRAVDLQLRFATALRHHRRRLDLLRVLLRRRLARRARHASLERRPEQLGANSCPTTSPNRPAAFPSPPLLISSSWAVDLPASLPRSPARATASRSPCSSAILTWAALLRGAWSWCWTTCATARRSPCAASART